MNGAAIAVGEVEEEVVISIGSFRGAVEVFVVVCGEEEVIAQGAVGLVESIAIGVTEFGDLGFLAYDETVFFNDDAEGV